jgi:hypothetical protein
MQEQENNRNNNIVAFEWINPDKKFNDNGDLQGICPICGNKATFRTLKTGESTAEWINGIRRDGLVAWAGQLFDTLNDMCVKKIDSYVRIYVCLSCHARYQVCEKCLKPNKVFDDRDRCDHCGEKVIPLL